MKAFVVYEPGWPNTEAIARAIAEGIGGGAEAVPANKATPERLADADLLVAGAPVLDFAESNEGRDAVEPPAERSSLRPLLEALPPTRARGAAFETRLWLSSLTVRGAIAGALAKSGIEVVGEAAFVVRHRHGSLRAGEEDRARAWGAKLASSVR